MKLNFHEYHSKDKTKPEQLVILLHGYGSNGTDLISLAPELQDLLPNAFFVSPDAPFPYEGGMKGAFQWYSLLDRNPIVMLNEARNVEPILNQFIDEQLKRTNLDANSLIVIGFSQGGMMALYHTLKRVEQALAIVSFSGYLLDDGKLNMEVKSTPPVFLTHGSEDQIVPIHSFHYTEKLLKNLGCSVESLLVPGLGHGIDYECIQKAGQFLRNSLMKKASLTASGV